MLLLLIRILSLYGLGSSHYEVSQQVCRLKRWPRRQQERQALSSLISEPFIARCHKGSIQTVLSSDCLRITPEYYPYGSHPRRA